MRHIENSTEKITGSEPTVEMEYKTVSPPNVSWKLSTEN